MNPADRPNRIPWPPILFFGALLLANVLSMVLEFGLFRPPAWASASGIGMFGTGIGVMLWAFLAFRAHNTSILPHKRSDHLIRTGPFRFSRNPIYLAEILLLFGLGLMNGSIWYLAVIPPFIWLVTMLAIVREEAHLSARFGPDWTAYAKSVRRWI